MRTRLAGAVVVAAAFAASTAAFAERPEPAETAPDVRHCALEIRPDPASGRLRVGATLDIANPSAVTEFSYYLADWYDSVQVASREGPAAVTHENGVVTVRVERPSVEERLVFALSGVPGASADDPRPVFADSSIYLVWSDRFYPVDFDDWTLVSVRIEMPPGFRALAPGRRTSAERQGDVSVESFETSQPIRAATVIADRRWVETERTVFGLTMRTLLYADTQHRAEEIFQTSGDVLAFYESRFGPYAFDEFTFAIVEGIYARRALAGAVIYSPKYLAGEFETTGHDAHETALLWWFYTIAGRGPGSYQWIEGFGDYAEMLYDEARGLPIPGNFEKYRDGYLRMAGTSEEPPITAPRGPLAGNFIHGRLPWLMHLVRFAAGDSAFDAGVRHLFDRWRFRSFTLDEFVSTLSEGTGQPLDWWRDEWLHRGGVPEIAWHADITTDPAGGFRVEVAVGQTGALYRLPLEIGIDSEVGMIYQRVRLDEKSASFQFRSTLRPTRIVLDPRRWLLAKITEE